jgi:hypothetical protein
MNVYSEVLSIEMHDCFLGRELSKEIRHDIAISMETIRYLETTVYFCSYTCYTSLHTGTQA